MCIIIKSWLVFKKQAKTSNKWGKMPHTSMLRTTASVEHLISHILSPACFISFKPAIELLLDIHDLNSGILIQQDCVNA